MRPYTMVPCGPAAYGVDPVASPICAREFRESAEPRPFGTPMGQPVVLGVACGAGAALFWAAGFVAARHGIAVGFSPADIAFHRFVWAGLLCLPLVVRAGLGDLAGVGWVRGVVLTLLGGPPLALFSYAGFLFVPLAHGGVIQPSCAALGGLVLASLVLKEKLAVQRAVGGAIIVAGLVGDRRRGARHHWGARR